MIRTEKETGRTTMSAGYSLKSNILQGGTSSASQISKITSNDTEQSAVSILLMCVLLMLTFSASLDWERPARLR